MRFYGLFLTILATTLLIGAVSYGGPGSSGGGFAYSNTSVVLLRNAIEKATHDISYFVSNETCSNEFLSQHGYKHPINFAEIFDIIKTTHRSFNNRPVRRKNDDGQLEPLLYHYGTDQNGKKYIVALKAFFDANSNFTPYTHDSKKIEAKVASDLIHEATHLYGYGIKDTPENLDRVSSFLTDILVRPWLFKGCQFHDNYDDGD